MHSTGTHEGTALVSVCPGHNRPISPSSGTRVQRNTYVFTSEVALLPVSMFPRVIFNSVSSNILSPHSTWFTAAPKRASSTLTCFLSLLLCEPPQQPEEPQLVRRTYLYVHELFLMRHFSHRYSVDPSMATIIF